MLTSRPIRNRRRVCNILPLSQCLDQIVGKLPPLLLVCNVGTGRWSPLCRGRSRIVLLQSLSVIARGPVEVVSAALCLADGCLA
jgi:hypothetical protein